MKYYSDITKKLYNTEKEALAAEVEVKKKADAEAQEAAKAKRATKAKEVEAALKVANEAQQKAIQLLKDFIKDYGYFHTSYTSSNEKNENVDFWDILHSFLL